MSSAERDYVADRIDTLLVGFDDDGRHFWTRVSVVTGHLAGRRRDKVHVRQSRKAGRASLCNFGKLLWLENKRVNLQLQRAGRRDRVFSRHRCRHDGASIARAPYLRCSMRLSHFALACFVLSSVACHTERPIISPGPKPPSVGGTIAGIVKTEDPSVAPLSRKVTAIDVRSGSRFDATTGTNGGYTIQVPVGTYRLEVELRNNETLVKQPAETHVNNGDLDPARDFVIAVKRASD